MQVLVQRSKTIVPNPLPSCGRATHRIFRRTRDSLDIRFGFEGQIACFRDALLGVQLYDMASCRIQKGTYFDNPFFVPCGNTVKLKINYWQKCNFDEDVSSCVISLERGKEEFLNIEGHVWSGTCVQKYLNKIKLKLTKHQVINWRL